MRYQYFCSFSWLRPRELNCRVMGKKWRIYLLSDHVGIMTSFDLEGTIICPKVDRVHDACNTSLVDLGIVSRTSIKGVGSETNHFSSLCSGDGKFKIRIFLPVSKEQRELGKEAIIYFTGGGDGLRAGVSIEAAF